MLQRAGCRAWAWTRAASAVRGTAGVCVGRRQQQQQQQQHRSYCDTNSPSDGARRWWHEADEVVRRMTALVQEGVYTNGGTITLNTARPVGADVFEDVLHRLYRKATALQVCFAERDGQVWVADMATPKIDFQVMEGGSYDEINKATADIKYKVYEGPLWRARLVVCPPDEVCHMPELKAAFPHQYHLALNVHHAVHDAVSLMTIMQATFTILDQVLDGATVDDTPLGEMRDGREIRAAEAKIRDNLEKDPQRLAMLQTAKLNLRTRVPLLTKTFGTPQEPCPTTGYTVPQVLHDKLLQAFMAKCKARRVTFNSGFVCLMNAGLVEMAREAGVEAPDSYYEIASRHPVDTRRYMSGVKGMVWGYHGIPVTHVMPTPADVINNFWQYVAEFDTQFRTGINQMIPLEQRIVDTMLPPPPPDHQNRAIFDYFLTNMHSPRVKPYGRGKHAHLTYIKNYMELTNLDFRLACGVNSFRDDVQYQFAFSTGFITAQDAARYSDKVFSVFEDIATRED